MLRKELKIHLIGLLIMIVLGIIGVIGIFSLGYILESYLKGLIAFSVIVIILYFALAVAK